MARFYLSRHTGPLTSHHSLLRFHWVTSCALNIKYPSCLHHRLHSWVWNAFPASIPSQLPIILRIPPHAAYLPWAHDTFPNTPARINYFLFHSVTALVTASLPILYSSYLSNRVTLQDSTDPFRVTFCSPHYLLQLYKENRKWTSDFNGL